MRKRLALFCFRVARWLAPDYFANKLQSITEIRMRMLVLRNRFETLSAKERDGPEGRFIVSDLQSLEGIYKSVADYGARYELVKVEIEAPKGLTKGGQQRVLKGEEGATVLHEETKRALFSAVVSGFTASAEIEKFMYFREHGKIKTVGIRLYLKHE